MSVSLITRERAQRNLGNISTFAAEELVTLDTMIAAVSEAIRQLTRRDFVIAEYDELYHGTGGMDLILKQYPLQFVSRVATRPVTVLEVTNTSSSNQQAWVAVGKDGLTLTRIASGTRTLDTSITWASYATITAMNTAINALGSGWTSRIPDATYADWGSTNLRGPQGNLACKNSHAGLRMHVEDLANFDVIANLGVLRRRESLLEGYFYGDDQVDCPGWYGGADYYRVIYTAGYDEVPEPVQQACAEWTAQAYWETKQDPSFLPGQPPASAAALLLPYRRNLV